MSDIDFRAEMLSQGLVPPVDIPVGKWVRFAGTGKKGSNRAGYCYLFEDMLGGIFGDFSTGMRGVWQAERVSKYAPADKIRFEAMITAKRQEAEEKQESKWAESARLAEEFISKCTPADPAHPYLVKKGVKPYGVLQSGNLLVIPLSQSSGKLVGYQTISPDGSKLYNSGVHKTGACAVLDGVDGGIGRVCVCEGFATGASIHEATGYKVLIAMDAGNLIHVVREAALRYTGVIVCADNDHSKPVNAGISAAQKIQEELGIPYIYPVDIKGTDFNDLHSESGLEAVTDAVVRGRTVEVYQPDERNEYPKEICNPPGILKDIADYYNATAVKPQPLFAIAAGLALGSVVLGRRYNTGPYENFTSLYMIIAAKSGTGKDHVKQIVRTILAAAGCQWMERGEGFTAANTVVKALEKQPLQISFFEEIGARLQEAAANNRSSARGTFRKLLDIWSSCHSFSVGEEFADGSVPRTERPALTMVGLTTPKALAGAITESLIEQGFVNRILPFISSEDRSAAPLNIKKTDPPQKIIDWVKAKTIAGDLTEAGLPYCPAVKDEIIVPFSDEALFFLNEIERDIMVMCDKLEGCNLDDMPTRNREITMRISLIAAVMDGAEVIQPKYVSWAWGLVRALYARYIDDIRRHVGGSDYEKAKMEALAHLRKISPSGVKPRDMGKKSPWSKWPKKLRNEILDELRDGNLADIVLQRTGKKGPPSEVWVAINS